MRVDVFVAALLLDFAADFVAGLAGERAGFFAVASTWLFAAAPRDFPVAEPVVDFKPVLTMPLPVSEVSAVLTACLN